MPTVTRIFESRHVPGRWYAETDGGEALRVNVALIADFSLYTGRELSGEEYARLTAAASRMNARTRALKLLGFRAMSRRELVDKLTQKGESPEDAQEAADYLEELGYLDDAQYAASLVRHYAGKGYGPGRVRQELFRRGVRSLPKTARSSPAPTIGARAAKTPPFMPSFWPSTRPARP